MMDINSNNSDGGETTDYDDRTENLDLLLRIMEKLKQDAFIKGKWTFSTSLDLIKFLDMVTNTVYKTLFSSSS